MRASRLLSILLLLQTRGRMTAAELAAETGVSLRTVYRDIDALAAAGVPLSGEPGPAGGYRLVEGYRTRLTGLTPEEAGALFFAGVPGPAADLGLGPLLATAELKLLAALPKGLRSAAALARERFLLDAPGWFRQGDRPPHLAAVAAAVWEQRPLRVRYRGRGGDRESAIDPLGLVLKAGAWYLVARPRPGDEVRTYRVSRILAAEPEPEPEPGGRGTEGGAGLGRPDGFDLAEYWRASAAAFLATLYRERATVRLSPRGLDLLRHVVDPWVAKTALASADLPAADGWVRLLLPIESVEIGATQLLQLGAEAEVLAPPELRRRLRAAARAMAERYDED